MSGEVNFKDAYEESNRTSVRLAARVATLEREYAELQKRLTALEKRKFARNGGIVHLEGGPTAFWCP